MSDPLSTSRSAGQAPARAPAAAPKPDASAPPPQRERGGGFVSTILWALMLALVVRTFLFQPFTIPSESMRPTLEIGDYVISSKWPYGYSRYSLPFTPDLFEGRVLGRAPKRGEVIVFRVPHAGGQSYIKRVIGLPGETVELRGGILLIGGAEVPRRRVGEDVRPDGAGEMRRYTIYEEILPGGVAYEVLDLGAGDLDDFGPVTIPADHVFVLGDNRDESRDSRVPPPLGPGPVPLETMVGRADLVLLSARPDFSLWKPWTWHRLRSDRFARSLSGEPD